MADDVQTPVHESQVFFVAHVAARQALPHGAEQPFGEQADEQFQQVAALAAEAGEIAIRHTRVPPCHAEHVQQCSANAIARAIDFGKYLKRRARHRDDANNLRRLDATISRSFQDEHWV